MALVLTGTGELLISRGANTPLNLVLYLAGILVFALSAGRPRRRMGDPVVSSGPGGASGPVRRFGWIMLALGTAVAVGLGLASAMEVDRDLKSQAGTALWVASLATIGTTGVALHRLQGWPARWGAAALPRSARGRWLLCVAVVVLVAVAAAARLLFLDAIPFGIIPDEGDRAATSIQILRGANTRGIFDSGWYRISMLYFWLLAQLMAVIGIGYAQARVFSALSSLLTVAVILWLGIRHFGPRVGLLAGALAALMGVLLHFARLTTEATPTALLWALSMGLFLEAARRGRLWAWIGAGLAGGLGIYFYASGRLWIVLAAGFCTYLFIHGLGGQRRGILLGATLAALAGLLVMLPLFVLERKQPGVFGLRAEETSIFTRDNVSRLGYYRREWSTPQLISVQTSRAFGLFHEIGDAGGSWPTNRPIMSHPLALLTLLGLGWSSLSRRDPRLVGLAMWFWTGFVGVIVTVETPNLQRAATALPVLALFPALVLDNLSRRIERLRPAIGSYGRRNLRLGASGVTALVVIGLAWSEARFYFVDSAAMDFWAYPRIETEAVRSQGTDTLVTSLGRNAHMVNSGWVRLMAPETPRGGIRSPGSDLPLAVPADRNLAFAIYPRQEPYLGFLREVYPGGSVVRWTHPKAGYVLTMYHVSQEQWAATQGALARPPDGPPLRVATLGAVPPGWTAYSGPMRWTAGLRAPRYWNYGFLIGPGPARLTIDGIDVLSVPAGTETLSAVVSLPRGLHAVAYEGTVSKSGQPALFSWAPLPESVTRAEQVTGWEAVPPEALVSSMTMPSGLLGIVRPTGRPEQRRLDGTLATCCLSEEVGARQHVTSWTGTLTAPVSGVYPMSILALGSVDLRIDNRGVIHTDRPINDPVRRDVQLEAGPHAVEVTYRAGEGSGAIEWTWTPPGGEPSFVPPSALSPPGAAVGPPVPADRLGSLQSQPVTSPLSVEP